MTDDKLLEAVAAALARTDMRLSCAGGIFDEAEYWRGMARAALDVAVPVIRSEMAPLSDHVDDALWGES